MKKKTAINENIPAILAIFCIFITVSPAFAESEQSVFEKTVSVRKQDAALPGTTGRNPYADTTAMGNERNRNDKAAEAYPGKRSERSDLPNLTPYKPYEWDNTIVVSDKTGTNTDDAVYAGETVYIDIACLNDSTTDISEGFYVELYANETLVSRLYYYWEDGGLPQGYYGSDEDIEHTFPESGTYTLKLVCDADNYIPESDETDNEYQRIIPGNDNFINAISLTGISGQTTGSNRGATKETGEPDHAGSSGGESVWWTWTAPETEYFYFDTHGSSFNTLLGVYTGPDVDSLTEIAGNGDDGSDNDNSSLTFQAQSGVRYYIAVDGWYGQSGDIVLNRRKAVRPENDDFADAITLTGESGQTTGSNTEATKEAGEPDHAGISGGKSVWWAWTAPETGYFYFDTHGSSFGTLLGVYTGPDVGSLTEIASNYNSSLVFQAQSDVRYYIAVNSNYWGESGDIILNWRKAVRPENDDFADAITLTGESGQTAGANTDATKETGEPNHVGWSGGKSVWWAWTAPETEYFYFDTHGSSFNTLLGVYTGPDVDSLTEIAGNDDDGSDSSSLVFQAQSGVRYYIAVDGRWYGESGDIVLNSEPAPAFDPARTMVSGKLSMVLYDGQAYISGEAIKSGGHVLLAFGPGGKDDCRGKSDIFRYGDKWVYHIDIVSDNEGEEITFRIWDSGNGGVYNVTDTVQFASDTLLEKNIDIPLRLESADPAVAETGKDSEMTLTGTGFDKNTRVSMYPDIGNKKAIVGSADTPGFAREVTRAIA